MKGGLPARLDPTGGHQDGAVTADAVSAGSLASFR
jgi:hypothetical protein